MKNIPIANSYQFMLISYIIEIELGNSMSTQFNANMIDAGEVVNLPHKAQFGRQAETAIGSLFGRQLNTISEGRYVIRTIINTMMSTVTDPGGTLIARSGRRHPCGVLTYTMKPTPIICWAIPTINPRISG
jgi:hypothetical protein